MKKTNQIQVALAPMAGVSDSAFRLMNQMGGCDLTYSEMAHVNGVSYLGRKTFNLLQTHLSEKKYIVQLFGNNPQYFARATKIISQKGLPVASYKPFDKQQLNFVSQIVTSLTARYSIKNNPELASFQLFWRNFLKFQADLILLQTLPKKQRELYLIPAGLDINLGCPAKKVFGHGSGAGLFTDIPKIRQVVETVLENTDLPISLKLRTSVRDVSVFDALNALADLPLKHIMIHGRSYEQGFSGNIDVETIKKTIAKYPQFEFWVNGGIIDYSSAQKIILATGCQRLGIARGSWGNPLLANTIKKIPDFAETPKLGVSAKSIPVHCALAYIHTILNSQSKGSKGFFEIRKHLAWYFKDFTGAKDWRKKLVTVKSIPEVEKILKQILKAKK